MATEQEIHDFVSKNKELIESIMELQKEGFTDAVSVARGTAKTAADVAQESAEAVKAHTEEFFKTTYNMFMDPEVQRHFFTMGMEFMMGMSAMMQKAPVPDFMKESAETAEKEFKATACKANESCGAKKVQKVQINAEPTDDAEE